MFANEPATRKRKGASGGLAQQLRPRRGRGRARRKPGTAGLRAPWVAASLPSVNWLLSNRVSTAPQAAAAVAGRESKPRNRGIVPGPAQPRQDSYPEAPQPPETRHRPQPGRGDSSPNPEERPQPAAARPRPRPRNWAPPQPGGRETPPGKELPPPSPRIPAPRRPASRATPFPEPRPRPGSASPQSWGTLPPPPVRPLPARRWRALTRGGRLASRRHPAPQRGASRGDEVAAAARRGNCVTSQPA
ncbi:translation initiation factor IF-2-like [Talpa occidentalis]|uniref:translation initiation factor IF-2-like n=1 Tax=Talpa occidentalis TaxID=50954 RepID=UPI0023F99F51|nr:translation initiation factor IF-2-like [Talpa occidentalis]